MLIFGVITCVTGLAGVAIGLFLSNRMKKAGNERADAQICATGQFLMGICTCVGLLTAVDQPMATWVLAFIGMVGNSTNWALQVKMTMETCVPRRRATANAMQLLLGHALGDAISPILIGGISDSLSSYPQTIADDFTSLKYAIFVCPLASIIGAFGFLAAANHIEQDKKFVMSNKS